MVHWDPSILVLTKKPKMSLVHKTNYKNTQRRTSTKRNIIKVKNQINVFLEHFGGVPNST